MTKKHQIQIAEYRLQRQRAELQKAKQIQKKRQI
jgi:hypothetical protein